MPDINECFCSWPSPERRGREGFDSSDYSKDNIKRVRTQIAHLENKKRKHEDMIKSISSQLEKYKAILKELEEGREKHAKVVEIVDDDNEFDDF